MPENNRSQAPHRLTRLLLITVVLLLVTSCSNPFGSDSDQSDSSAREESGTSILPMTLTEWIYPPDAPPTNGEPVGLAHVSLSPLEPGSNSINVVVTDLDGNVLTAAASAFSARLTIQSLTPNVPPITPQLEPGGDDGTSWTVDDVNLPDQGWYEITVSLEAADDPFGAATMHTLLPDPSVYGVDAVRLPETDPEAQALYERTLERFASWDAVKWRESLGSGTDVLVVTDFTLTNRPGEIPAFMTDTQYSGTFRPRSDGTAPAQPRYDYAGSITIGDSAWRRRDDSGWEEVPTLGVSTQPERADIFTGATNIRFGGTDVMHGREVEVITFYLPQKGGQADAWFAWWVDPETGDLLRLAMITYMHFMIWDFYAINGSYTIGPPPGIPAASPTAAD